MQQKQKNFDWLELYSQFEINDLSNALIIGGVDNTKP